MDGAPLVNLSNLIAKFRSIDVIANNIANASTPGFKREVAKFEEFLKQMPPSEGEEKPEILSLVANVGVDRDLSQGSINLTGAPYDLAINGKGILSFKRHRASGIHAMAISRWITRDVW
jgi:flagellar hook-basal body protein